jgi:hypothetical protein
MLKLKLPLFITSIIVLNILIYYRAYLTIEPIDTIFAECARNSGRTSAAINLITLFMVGYFGLKTIYNEKIKIFFFRTLIILFAVNHLIHFFFVSQNFKLQDMELSIWDNLHGFITFLCLVLLPVLLYLIKRLNKMTYSLILIHLFNVTYLISKSFYVRYKPEDPAYLHRIGVLIMIIALLYILYRVYKEKSMKFTADNIVPSLKAN